MAIGKRYRTDLIEFAVGAETTYGTRANCDKQVGLINSGITLADPNYEWVPFYGVGVNSRDMTFPVQGREVLQGNIPNIMYCHDASRFLSYMALGSYAHTSTEATPTIDSAYAESDSDFYSAETGYHHLREALVLPSFTIGTHFRTVDGPGTRTIGEGFYRFYTGCKVSRLTLNFNEGQAVMANLDYIAQDIVTDLGDENTNPKHESLSSSNLNMTPMNEQPFFFSYATLTYHGVPFARFRSLTITIDNQIDPRYYVRDVGDVVTATPANVASVALSALSTFQTAAVNSINAASNTDGVTVAGFKTAIAAITDIPTVVVTAANGESTIINVRTEAIDALTIFRNNARDSINDADDASDATASSVATAVADIVDIPDAVTLAANTARDTSVRMGDNRQILSEILEGRVAITVRGQLDLDNTDDTDAIFLQHLLRQGDFSNGSGDGPGVGGQQMITGVRFNIDLERHGGDKTTIYIPDATVMNNMDGEINQRTGDNVPVSGLILRSAAVNIAAPPAIHVPQDIDGFASSISMKIKDAT